MFAFRKDTIKVTGVEKYFERENKEYERARRKAGRRRRWGLKNLIIPILALMIIAALGVFIRSQQQQIAQLRGLRDGEMNGLRSRILTLVTELEDSGKEVQALKESISDLQKQLETEQSHRVRAEAALKSRLPAKRKL